MPFTAELKIIIMRSTLRRYSEFHAVRDVQATVYIYIYIYIYLNVYIYIYNIINNSQRKDKGNQWHDGGCISDTKFC